MTLLAALACPAPDADTGAAGCPACAADLAVYDPEEEEDGVWEAEVDALEALAAAEGWTLARLGPAELPRALGEGEGRRFRALVAPGGHAFFRDRDVDEAGEEAVRAFVRGGGGYVGFCAGTAWASATVSWAAEATGGGGTFNRKADYREYAYDLGLFPGVARAPFSWTPWAGGAGASLQPVAWEAPVEGLPAASPVLYYGGPVFHGAEGLEELDVWARAVAPAGLSGEAAHGDGDPTVLTYRHGRGLVALASYHPLVLVGSDEDGVILTGAVDEASWDLAGVDLDAANRHSRAVARALLAAAAGLAP